MKTTIIAKIRINFEDPTQTVLIVRKIVTHKGNIVQKRELMPDGGWVPTAEGFRFPQVPTQVYDNFSPNSLESNQPGGLSTAIRKRSEQ